MLILMACSISGRSTRIRSFATAFFTTPHCHRSTTRVISANDANSWTASPSMMHHHYFCNSRHDYYLSPSPPIVSTMSSTRAFLLHASSSSLYSTSSENDKLLDDTNNDSVVVIDEDEWNADINMIDPYSDQAFIDLTNFYTHHNINNSNNNAAGAAAIDVKLAYKKLLRLTEAVIGWNERLNLISRKDCTPTVVYHRHVLPSIALLPLILDEINTHHTNNNNNNNNDSNNAAAANTTPIFNIMDVGTGGGFPGLPLALLLPSVQFTLVDSIKKKLLAVSDMASELDVANVRIHHGRVEEMYINENTGMTNTEHYNKYNIILGRSVTALPRFCGWVTNLIQREPPSHQEGGSGGRLIYIIGGELDEIVSSRIVQDVPIDKLLCRTKVMSDKRALIFNAQDVYEIARNSGEEIVRNDVVVVRNNSSSRGSPSPPTTRKKSVVEQSNTTGGGASGKSKPLAKGAWSKKQNDVKKQRGYDDFKRYES